MNIRVLVVDDDKDCAETCRRLLESLTDVNYVVDIAWTLATAVNRLSAGGVDAVVLDLGLPDGRGNDVVAKIRECDPLVGILAITGQSGPEAERPTKVAGADAFMTKPADPNRVNADIQYIVSRKRHLKEVLESGEPFTEFSEIVAWLRTVAAKKAEKIQVPTPPDAA